MKLLRNLLLAWMLFDILGGTTVGILDFGPALAAQTGSFSSIQLPVSNPPQPVANASVTQSGAAGSTQYFYWIVTITPVGNSAPQGPFIINTANSTLSGSNFDIVSWPAGVSPTGATGYDVLRTTTAAPPTGACNCAVATNTTSPANDQSNSLNSYTVNSYNQGQSTLTYTNPSGILNVNGMPTYLVVTADFTLAANTSLQTITGLSITVPAFTPIKIPFSCKFMYSQATAAVADQFGIQSATVAPTNIGARGVAYISTSTLTAGNLPTLATTTATAVVTFTPSATATVFNADMDGVIELGSSALPNTLNWMAQTSNGADLVTVKRDSFCRLF